MQGYMFVLNGNGTPLSPCHPAVARKLLKQGHASVERIVPFTIQLQEIRPKPTVQPTTIGIDDGAKTAGIVVIQHNRESNRVVLKVEVRLRNNVKRLLDSRRYRRRHRRSKKRHRQPRHRRASKQGWIPPSTKVRKDNILRVVRNLASLVPVDHIVYEEGQFDTRALWDNNLEDYQVGPNTGFGNRKAAVLWRDRHTCQYCGIDCIKSKQIAEVDHIIPRSRGGTAAWTNLICACRPCNQAKGNQTAAEFGHSEIQGRTLKFPAWLQQGKTYVKAELQKVTPLESRFGWETAEKRRRWGMEKSHLNDALVLARSSKPMEDCLATTFKATVRRRRHSISRKYSGFMGFRHWDIVNYTKLSGESFLGTVCSFTPSRKIVKCRLPFSDNWPVSFGRLQLVERPGSIVYIPQVNAKERNI